MKYFVFLIFFLFAFSLKPIVLSAQGKYNIEAEVIGKKVERGTFVLYDTTFKKERPFVIEHNRFKISDSIQTPFFCKISFPELSANINFPLDRGATKLTIIIDSIQSHGQKFYEARIINDFISEIQKRKADFLKRLIDITHDSVLTQIEKGNLLYNVFKQSLKKNPQDIYIAESYTEIDYFTLLQAKGIFSTFSPRLQSIAKRFGASNFLIRAEKTAIGEKYTDFLEKDSLNQVVAINSLKFKFLLIDFGASTCGPCREQFPELKELYAKYHTTGFEILGTYLDLERKYWTRSIIQDQIPWPTVSSLIGFGAKIARYYGLTYIPFNILINDKMEIVGKNFSPSELRWFLKTRIR